MNFPDNSYIVASTPITKNAEKPRDRSKDQTEITDSKENKRNWSPAAINDLYTRYLQSEYLLHKQTIDMKSHEEEMKRYLSTLIEINRTKMNEFYEEKIKLFKLQFETNLDDLLNTQLDTIKNIGPLVEVMEHVKAQVKTLDEKRHQITTRKVSFSSAADLREIETIMKSLEEISNHPDKASVIKSLNNTCHQTSSWNTQISILEICKQLGIDIEDLIINNLSHEVGEMLAKD